MPPRDQSNLFSSSENRKRQLKMIDCDVSRKDWKVSAHSIFICDYIVKLIAYIQRVWITDFLDQNRRDFYFLAI